MENDLDLSKLLGLGEVQQQYQKRYSDALAEKRALIEKQNQYKQIAANANPGFAQALSSSNPVILDPADVFKSYQTFNAAVAPGMTAADKYTTDDDLLAQIASIAQQREKKDSGMTVDELVKQRQTLADAGFDTTTIDIELEKKGFKKKEGDGFDKDLAKLGLDELAKQKDTLDKLGIDSSKIDKELERRGYGKGAGEVGQDEVNAVNVIDDILNQADQVIKGSTGVVKAGKILSPMKTPGLRINTKQLIGILQLAAKDQLKGQGQVSNAERQLLKDSVSNLGIKDDGTTDLPINEFKSRLEELRTVLAKKSNDPTLINKYVNGGSSEKKTNNLPIGLQTIVDFLGNKGQAKNGFDEDALIDEVLRTK